MEDNFCKEMNLTSLFNHQKISMYFLNESNSLKQIHFLLTCLNNNTYDIQSHVYVVKDDHHIFIIIFRRNFHKKRNISNPPTLLFILIQSMYDDKSILIKILRVGILIYLEGAYINVIIL